MPLFKYTVVSKDGRTINGSREAVDRDEVAAFLHEQSLVVVSIDENVAYDLKKIFSTQIGGIPLSERVVLAKQLATMLTAGLPIIQALDILVQQTKNVSLKRKLTNVYKAVEAGSDLAEAFAKEQTIFSELQISLLAAGERSGNLNQVMLQIAEDLEKSKQLRSKIVGAMIYPVVILVVMTLVLVIMLVFMVPSVKDLYADFGVAELPFITQILVDMSTLFTSPVGIISTISIVTFVVLGYRYMSSTYAGRRTLDKILLRLPVFGSLTQKVQLVQFNRLLAMLLQSGVPIIDSLRIVANALSNSQFKDLINQAADEVTKGNSVSVPLSKGGERVFPIIMLKMLATGEQTGNIDKVTGDMARYYEAEVEEVTSNLTKLMEPFILLLVGGLVGFLAIAVYLPLYSIGQYI